MITPETFILDPSAPGTLQSRIRQMVAQGILNGRFRAGEKLPSSRRLAQHLKVSRITVTLAYTELLADDYITSRGRSGYFVSDNAPALPVITQQPQRRSTVVWPRLLGPASPALGLSKPADWSAYRYNFIYGQPDPTLFDSANWRLCALQALGKRDFAALTADQFDGDDPQLIDFIARQTLPRRGILAGPDEILLTLGAQNALWLTAQTLLTPDSVAVIEDPCYPSLRTILRQSRCRIHPVAVDAQGLPPGAVPPGVDILFTTPGLHCPTTATMPQQRRKALLDRAEAENFLVVEDDYEFDITTPPLPALKSLDRDGRVIHVGSFSKSLFPGLRLGYLVGPAPFIAAARRLRATVLRHPPGHIQRTLAHYLSLGHYDAQMRRMGRAYAARRATMHAALAEHGLIDADRTRVPGGTSFWLEAPVGTDTLALTQRLQAQGVLIEPGAPFFGGQIFGDQTAPRRFYRMAYSSVPVGRIADGVALVKAGLQ
jgi:GntR family transcriptional regulator / MocR family aminotransferase